MSTPKYIGNIIEDKNQPLMSLVRSGPPYKKMNNPLKTKREPQKFRTEPSKEKKRKGRKKMMGEKILQESKRDLSSTL
jgi:hypothetical protein